MRLILLGAILISVLWIAVAVDLDSIILEGGLAVPSAEPSALPTTEPTAPPTFEPTATPTYEPTAPPTFEPTAPPTYELITPPTFEPSAPPSIEPTALPTQEPSADPTMNEYLQTPSSQPSRQPSGEPSSQPSNFPTSQPTANPSSEPSSQPSRQPTSKPSTVCPAEWLMFDSKCYYFPEMTGLVGNCTSYCTQQHANARLPCIENEAENTFIASHQQQQGNAFLTLHNGEQDGTFLWGTGCSSTFTSWGANEPTGGIEERIVVTSGGLWSDELASTEQFCACEYFAGITSSPTAAPTLAPTLTPTEAPSAPPTLSPSSDPTSTPTTICPPNWIHYGYKCYYFSPAQMSIGSCRTYCPAQHADASMLCVENAAENAFIYPNVKGYTFIDISDAVTENTWLWGAGCSSTYSNFGSGESFGGTGENIAIFVTSTSPNWADIPDGWNAYCACHFGVLPTQQPTARPSTPTAIPTLTPSNLPTIQPSTKPTAVPTTVPTAPSALPTDAPSRFPTAPPTFAPTRSPTAVPTGPTWAPTAQPSTFCAEGWSEFDYKCYIFNSVITSYAACLAYCPTLRADATTLCIEWSGQNAFIASKMRSSTWVGITDEVLEGTFVWFEGCGAQFTNFGPGEPNNSGGVEDFVMIHWNGNWNDVSSGSSAYCGCEYPGGPTRSPTAMPSRPTALPTIMPSRPTAIPTRMPTARPTVNPSASPTVKPSATPTSQPSSQPSTQPVIYPTARPSSQPSSLPTCQPTSSPSAQPSTRPSAEPSAQPSSAPSAQPSGQPTGEPTGQPSLKPSVYPSGQPSSQPSSQPVLLPTARPTSQPTDNPTCQPSAQPSSVPTTEPSAQPSSLPTCQPSAGPTSQPSVQPTAEPSGQPSTTPTAVPSAQPSGAPSSQPSKIPSAQPSDQPTAAPSMQPSMQPTSEPSSQPTGQPSTQPSVQPSALPSVLPSAQPSGVPSGQPSRTPTSRPSMQPSAQPSQQPSGEPSGQPTASPTKQPTVTPSGQPSSQPSASPSTQPSGVPTTQPSCSPSSQPSGAPSSDPTGQPSAQPSREPSAVPSAVPSSQPSGKPSFAPSSQPSVQPSSSPSSDPTSQPSMQPSCQPSAQPSTVPTSEPSSQPSGQPTHHPSAQPSTQPTNQPSAAPSSLPTAQPSCEPTCQPTSTPSAEPSGQPSAQPSSAPTSQPSSRPSSQPSVQPSARPTLQPSAQPSVDPTAQPSSRPSSQPSKQPTSWPSAQPSAQPSSQPTSEPSSQPTCSPTTQPSSQPSSVPSGLPSSQPSGQPSSQPSDQPTVKPSGDPTAQPTSKPSAMPTAMPSGQPSVQPTRDPTAQPSASPSGQPSSQPTSSPSSRPTTGPSGQPSTRPTAQPSNLPSSQPTSRPSVQPSAQPSLQPSGQPSGVPSADPTSQPSSVPTGRPSAQPSGQPSAQPTSEPTAQPSASPSKQPSSQPSVLPSSQPTTVPSGQPSTRPTAQPSRLPSGQPSSRPSVQPSTQPSLQPSGQPSGVPIADPTSQPSSVPTGRPSAQPSGQPSAQPTSEPTAQPSASPSKQPSSQPSVLPSSQPTTVPSGQPSTRPTAQPSRLPSGQPSSRPSVQPSTQPSLQPSSQPSGVPSADPTSQPSSTPSGRPSAQPSGQPSAQPTSEPTAQPSASPSMQPSSQPSVLPSSQPSSSPSAQPTTLPSMQPSCQPSVQPTIRPSVQPSAQPSLQPSGQPSGVPSADPTSQPSSTPSGRPSTQPSGQPSAQPTSEPTAQPSASPSMQPSSQPSVLPSSQPSSSPSAQPTTLPSVQPSCQPSVQPTSRPSVQPSASPSGKPSRRPSTQPSAAPTVQPSACPSSSPSAHPSLQPSEQPTSQPSVQPSRLPTAMPTNQPSSQPSDQPTARPSLQPSGGPTSQPTRQPSNSPSSLPTAQPSTQPSVAPSSDPTTCPSSKPSTWPTTQPTALPSAQPSSQPSIQPKALPSAQPTVQPSAAPTCQPSALPSAHPSAQPSSRPTSEPSGQPSAQPSVQPSLLPSSQPTAQPSRQPSSCPSVKPTVQPSSMPSAQPSAVPSARPTGQPSTTPSTAPSALPTRQPTGQPSRQPSSMPSTSPSNRPTVQPSSHPTGQPTCSPSGQPFSAPTSQPSSDPSSQPSRAPSREPTGQPSAEPTMSPTVQPSAQPSCAPSALPSAQPSELPSAQPSSAPSVHPTSIPSALPSAQPSQEPSAQPNVQPTSMPSSQPSADPSAQPSRQPSRQPSGQPTMTPSYEEVKTTKRPSCSPSARPSTSAPTVYWKAPVLTHIASDFTADRITLNLTHSPPASYPGRVYCAAFLNSAANITSVGQVVTAGSSVSYPVGATASQVALSGLRALSSYATYCYLETAQGIGNSLQEVLSTRRSHTTACCRSIAFTNAPSELFGSPAKYPADQTSRYVFTFTLSAAPTSDLLVTPVFNSTVSSTMIPSNVIATTPTSLRFLAGSTSLAGSFILNVNSALFSTGSYVLWTKLTGASSHEYFGTSTAVRILSVSEAPSPPLMSSAVFSADGSALIITFDSATDQKVSSGLCSLLFTFDGVQKATCTWTSNSVVRAIFSAYDGSGAYAAPGNLITLQALKIKAKCNPGESCTGYATSPEHFVTARASSSSVRPSVSIALPRSVAACANVSVDASMSSGHGGRPWASVVWTVGASLPGSATAPLATLLNSLGTSLAQIARFPASRYASAGVEYSLSMTATNFLGQSGSSSVQFSLSGNPNLPTVQVLGDSLFTVTPASTITVYSASSKSLCAEQAVKFITSWRLFAPDGTALNVQSQSKDTSVLVLAPRSLLPGQRYLAQVTTIASATAANPSATASASAYITVQNGKVVAVVSGGDTRQVLAAEVVFIDASNSYDENTGAGVASNSLSFLWSCTYLTSARFGSSCSSVIVAGTSTNRRVSVNGLALDAAESYSFQVQVTATDGRTASKSIAVNVKDVVSSTVVFINDPPAKVNANSRLVLTAQLSAQYALIGSWTALNGGTIFPITTSTPQSVTFSAADVSVGIQYALLIPGNVLSAGSTVTFRLTANRVGATDNKYQSYSEVSVEINAPPSSGSFDVSPPSGEALTTSFRLSAVGWTDASEDLPLSYMFSYIPNLESGALVIQPRQGANTVSAVLPSGSESLDYIITLSVAVYDTLLAFTASTGEVTVTALQSTAALDVYVDDSLATFASTQDTSQATQLINNVATTINLVNCTLTSAAYCASRNRRPCADLPNTCSSCLPGFSGVVGSSNSKCLASSDGARRLSSQDGGTCTSNDDCLLGNCADDRCAVPAKLCPSSVPGSSCSGNGECVYSDSAGNVLDKVCTVYDTGCFARCTCSGGMVGSDCSLTPDALQALDSTRQKMCETFLQVAALSNPSASLLESLVNSLSATFDPSQVVFNSSYSACSAALQVVTALAAEDLLAEAGTSTISALLALTGKFVRVSNATAGYDGTLVTKALANIAQGVLSSMVNGQADVSVADENMQFTATKAQTSSIIALTPPLTEAEQAYGLGVRAAVELSASAASACDAGSGYVDMSITQWGVNPYPGAAELNAPQIRIESRVALKVASTATTGDPDVAVGAESKYFITFLFNSPQNFSSEAVLDGSNTTFPECTVYDPITSAYVPCDGCKVSSYTHTNVTFACYNVSNLCNSDASGGDGGGGDISRRLYDSVYQQRSLAAADDMYVDDLAAASAGTTGGSVSSVQYSALVSTAGNILGTNPFTLSFRAAKVIISFVAVLFAIVMGGMFYFHRWDVHDHNVFLYKHKELPHLRIDTKSMDGLPPTTSLIKFQTERFSLQRGGLAPSVMPASPSGKTFFSVPSFNLGFSAVSNSRRLQPQMSMDEDDFRVEAGNFTFSMKSNDSSQQKSFYKSTKSLGERQTSQFRSFFGFIAEEDEEVTEEKFLRGVITSYINAVIPLDFSDTEKTTWTKLAMLLEGHPVCELLFHPSLQQLRVLRWAAMCMDILVQLFIDTLFFSTFYPNAGECEAYETYAHCVTPKNQALGNDLCTWSPPTAAAGASTGVHCTPTPPPSDLTFTMVLVMITIVFALPLSFVFDIVMTEFCSKRPDFAQWGWNTEAILGRSTQSLGEFAREKPLSPIVSLRREVEASRQLMGESSHFHSEEYKLAQKFGDIITEHFDTSTDIPAATAAIATTTADANATTTKVSNLEEINLEARVVYEEFISVADEVEQMLQSVIHFLTVALHKRKVRWQSKAGITVAEGMALRMNAEKVQVIEEALHIRADGSPVPLSVWDRLFYRSPKDKLVASVKTARHQQTEIRKLLDSLGESEILSKDEALTQFFILEQFSKVKQYALRSQLFDFAVTTALPINPAFWLLGWTFYLCSYLFFFYWALAWGISTSDSTVAAWGTNFAISVGQEMLFVQTFRIYVLYMISTITIKPQLTAIYTTLQRLAVEYVQDELPQPLGVVRVVQHLSPACRVARMKVSDNLAAGQILRHIDDRDIQNFRFSSNIKLPMLLFLVVAIPVMIGAVNDNVGELILTAVIPSVLDSMVVAHYMLYKQSAYWVIVPYCLLVLYFMTREWLYKKALVRVRKYQQRRSQSKFDRSTAAWRKRTFRPVHRVGEVRFTPFSARGSLVAAVRAVGYCMRSAWTYLVDRLALCVYYASETEELGAKMHQYLFNSKYAEAEKRQWRNLNMPAGVHGNILSEQMKCKADRDFLRASNQPVLHPEIQSLSRNVTSLWDIEQGHHSGDCSTATHTYLQKLMYGQEDLKSLQPAKFTADEASAEIGKVLYAAPAPLPDSTANDSNVLEMSLRYKTKTGYCLTVEKALARVIAQYREQVLQGKIKFIYLLDEEQLLTALSPQEQLRYTGQVHYRDLLAMVEELLHFFRPHNQPLSPEQVEAVLDAFSQWASKHWNSIDEDVRHGVQTVIAPKRTGWGEADEVVDENEGFFRQHNLVVKAKTSRKASKNIFLLTDRGSIGGGGGGGGDRLRTVTREPPMSPHSPRSRAESSPHSSPRKSPKNQQHHQQPHQQPHQHKNQHKNQHQQQELEGAAGDLSTSRGSPRHRSLVGSGSNSNSNSGSPRGSNSNSGSPRGSSSGSPRHNGSTVQDRPLFDKYEAADNIEEENNFDHERFKSIKGARLAAIWSQKMNFSRSEDKTIPFDAFVEWAILTLKEFQNQKGALCR